MNLKNREKREMRENEVRRGRETGRETCEANGFPADCRGANDITPKSAQVFVYKESETHLLLT